MKFAVREINLLISHLSLWRSGVSILSCCIPRCFAWSRTSGSGRDGVETEYGKPQDGATHQNAESKTQRNDFLFIVKITFRLYFKIYDTKVMILYEKKRLPFTGPPSKTITVLLHVTQSHYATLFTITFELHTWYAAWQCLQALANLFYSSYPGSHKQTVKMVKMLKRVSEWVEFNIPLDTAI